MFGTNDNKVIDDNNSGAERKVENLLSLLLLYPNAQRANQLDQVDTNGSK